MWITEKNKHTETEHYLHECCNTVYIRNECHLPLRKGFSRLPVLEAVVTLAAVPCSGQRLMSSWVESSSRHWYRPLGSRMLYGGWLKAQSVERTAEGVAMIANISHT